MTLKILLVGEGKNELGSRTAGAQAPAPPEYLGVLETLLHRVAPSGWTVHWVHAWKSRANYRKPGHKHHGDYFTVSRLLLDLQETGADVLVFVRDHDGDPERPQAIANALAEAKDAKVIGGCAVQTLESWVLALKGLSKTEVLGKQRLRAELDKLQIGEKSTYDMAQAAAIADLDRLPVDAHSLRHWLDQARAVITRAPAEQ